MFIIHLKELQHSRHADVLAMSAASGVNLFDLAEQNINLRQKIYLTPVIVAESFFPDKPNIRRIDPKGKLHTVKENGHSAQLRIGAVGNSTIGRFSAQYCAAVQEAPAANNANNSARVSVPVMMLSANFLRLYDEYEKETTPNEKHAIIRDLQRAWAYQMHDHVHGLVRDFDDAAPSAFRRYDFTLQHARPDSELKVIKDEGPVTTQQGPTNEMFSELMVREGWRLRFLLDAKYHTYAGDEILQRFESAASDRQKITVLAKWLKDHRKEIEHFDIKNVEKGRLWNQMRDEIRMFDSRVQAFAAWASTKHNDPSLGVEIRNFCYAQYLNFMLNVVPQETPEIQKILHSNPEVGSDQEVAYRLVLDRFAARVNDGEKRGQAFETTSIWSIVRKYAAAMATHQNRKLEFLAEGLDKREDAYTKPNKLLEAHMLIRDAELRRSERAKKLVEMFKNDKAALEHVYNSAIYSVAKSIVREKAFSDNDGRTVRAALDAYNKVFGTVMSYQQAVDVWHLDHIINRNTPRYRSDAWSKTKIHAYVRYILGNDQPDAQTFEAIHQMLIDTASNDSKKILAGLELQKIAKEYDIRWQPRQESDAPEEDRRSQKAQVSAAFAARFEKTKLLTKDDTPYTHITGAILTIAPTRNIASQLVRG